MDKGHLILIGGWLAYSILHSMLAMERFKEFVKSFTGRWFRYYRPVYSLFAFITLAVLLWYQYRLNSFYLYQGLVIRYGLGIVLMIPGMIIMAVCIRKYFYELSGIQVFDREKEEITLQQQGLHEYVRHPLYFGTLLFAWGIFAAFPLFSNLIACVIMTIYVLIGIRIEEKKLLIEFGPSYKLYQLNVPMIIPRLSLNE